MEYTNLDNSYEYFSIVNTPMGAGGISGHVSSGGAAPPPPSQPMMGGGRGSFSGRAPPFSGTKYQTQPMDGIGRKETRWDHRPQWKRHRDRDRYYWNSPNYYNYYPYNYWPYDYYPYYNNYESEKCFCQDTDLVGALKDRMVCGRQGCGVCIDRYLCNKCNDNVVCKPY